MKVLVVGVGSIGSRHAANLSALGHEVWGVDRDPAAVRTGKAPLNRFFTRLEEALDARPEAALICTYSNDHIAPALACAGAGCHIFIEKPLSRDLRGIDELVRSLGERELVNMVGCNMRFHPALKRIKSALEEDRSFSRVLWANMEFGYYLPLAKPDYRRCYMGRQAMGGSLIFDSIHELDYACWFLGRPLSVFCRGRKVSSLDIDVDDCIDMMLRFESGAECTVHMDYLQHGYTRRCKIVAADATMVWDYPFKKLGRAGTDGRWVWEDFDLEIAYNRMYLDELEHFIECVRQRRETVNPVSSALPVLRLAMAAERSSRSGQWENVQEQR